VDVSSQSQYTIGQDDSKGNAAAKKFTQSTDDIVGGDPREGSDDPS